MTNRSFLRPPLLPINTEGERRGKGAGEKGERGTVGKGVTKRGGGRRKVYWGRKGQGARWGRG